MTSLRKFNPFKKVPRLLILPEKEGACRAQMTNWNGKAIGRIWSAPNCCYINLPPSVPRWHLNPLQNVSWQLRTSQTPPEWQRGKETRRRYAPADLLSFHRPRVILMIVPLNRRFLAHAARCIPRQDGRTDGIRRELTAPRFASSSRLTFRQFVIIDTEHGNIADNEMHTSVGVIASQGVSPMVRIPAPENWIVKRTLDTGGK